ncbi:subtilase family protein [Sarocladium implicatum]|nr:subtilase family protein [Sarocladium implicatum]
MAEVAAETPTTPTDPAGLFVYETGRRAVLSDNEGRGATDTEPDSDEDDDDDASSGSEEEGEDVEEPILTQIEDLKNLIKSGKQPEWKQIWKDYPLVDERDKDQGKSERDGRTILHHLIAEYADSREDEVRTRLLSAVKKVVSRCPNMLSCLDNSQRTPLYQALTSSTPKIVRTIVERLTADSEKTKSKTLPLTRALRVKCDSSRKENCLHAAMRLQGSGKAVSISLRTLPKLCDAADEATISAPDSDGKTPVHYAIDYQHCSEEQFDIVVQLLEKCGNKRANSSSRADHVHVLDRYIVRGETELSLYQYHKQTRADYIEREDSVRPKKPKPSNATEKTSSRRSEKKRDGKVSQSTEEVKHSEAIQSAHARPAERQKDERAGSEKKNPNRQPVRPPTTAPGNSRRAEDHKAHGAKEEQSQHQHKSLKQGGHRAVEEPKVEDAKDSGPPLANMRLPRSNTGSVAVAPSQTKPKAPEETKQQRINRRNLWSDRIQDVLKVKIMRYRSHDEITKFLYGKNTRNVQIYFDYRGQAPPVDQTTFKDSFAGIEFESVLKYVAFPCVEVTDWKQPRSTGGRSDMVFFFDWLRKKKVKRILRVIVNDSHEDGRSHSDEAIEKCLVGMEVEELEWQKENLDPETICRIDGILPADEELELQQTGERSRPGDYRNDENRDGVTAEGQGEHDKSKLLARHGKATGTLRQLHLWWGGDNAVLRGWSDPEGLRLLPQLKSIHLISRKGTLESDARTQRNIAMFKHRMSGKQANVATQTSTPKPVPEVSSNVASDDEEAESQPEGSNRHPNLTDLATRHIQVLDMVAHHGGSKSNPFSHEPTSSSKPSNRWIKSTEDFAKRVKFVWDELVGENGSNESPHDIVVALIDDGVDLKHQDLFQRVLPGRTFAADGEMVRPWYQSEKGHGTVMARAICHVCPMVKIYPIRLNTTGSVWHTAIDANSAIEAIEAAVDKKVDIISISWTVQVPTGEMKDRFKKAIERAIEAKILIFTSSADSGNFDDKYWPSGYSTEAFIRVGAAKPEGTPADMIGDLDKLDFILPGVDVSLGSSDDQTSQLVMERSETGSSIATALGAGLAAMLLYCTSIAVITGKNKVSKKHLEILHQRNDMKKAFWGITGKRALESDSKFVEVSQMFDNPPMDFRESLPIEQATTLIADWVRDLIPYSQFGT